MQRFNRGLEAYREEHPRLSTMTAYNQFTDLPAGERDALIARWQARQQAA
ncbi:MAG: hypothetical protein ACTHQQ_01020 [Solirubrobacteraceae bacterium]